MCTWHKTVDISKKKADTQLQGMAMDQSLIQQDIAECTYIKFWGDTPEQHAAREMMGTWKNPPEMTPWEEAPETVDG